MQTESPRRTVKDTVGVSACSEPWCGKPKMGGSHFCERHHAMRLRAREKLRKQSERMFYKKFGVTNVYAIKCRSAIKIGIAVDVKARLAGLQVASAEPMELLAWCQSMVATEKVLHSALRAHRIQGEWFHDGPDVRAIVDRIAAKEFEPKQFLEELRKKIIEDVERTRKRLAMPSPVRARL